MLGALDDLKLGLQGAVVQRRGHLAHAAADLLHGIIADEGARWHKAARLGALADDLVVGEGLTRLEDIAVDLLAGKANVLRSSGGPIVRAFHGGQNVAEQLLFELFAGIHRLEYAHLDGHALAGLCIVKELDRLAHVEAVAVGAVGDLIGILVAHGVDRRGAVAAVQRIEVDGRRIGLLHDILLTEFRRHIGILELRIERLDVDLAFLGAEGDVQRLFRARRGLGLALGELAAVLVRGGLQDGLDLRLVEHQIIRRFKILALGKRLVLQAAEDQELRAAVVIGGLDGSVRVQRHAGLRRRDRDGSEIFHRLAVGIERHVVRYGLGRLGRLRGRLGLGGFRRLVGRFGAFRCLTGIHGLSKDVHQRLGRVIGRDVEREIAAVKLDLHGVLVINLHTFFQRGLGFLAGHPADVHARDIEIADDPTVVTRQAEEGEHAHHQHHRDDHAHQQRCLFAAGFFLVRLRLFFIFSH